MRVNFDAVSGSLEHPAAAAARANAELHGWADPQRAHTEGRAARAILDRAREQAAAALGARPDEVAFTASLAQSHRRAVAGLAVGRARAGTHVVTSAVEHSALLHASGALADGWSTPGGQAWRRTVVGVDATGAVEAAQFAAAVTAEPTAFAVLQAASAEVGTRQPLTQAHALIAGAAPVLVDATAALGEPGLRDLPWDVLSAAAAHLGAPANCAVLAVRTGTRWRSPDRPTDAYEHGWVPGHPNIPSIAAFAAALEAAADTSQADRLRALTDTIRTRVPQLIGDCVVVGAATERVSHVVTMSFLYVSGAALAQELDAAGFAVASGSACSSDALTPSHVLAAMGALTEGNIRVSLPCDATAQQVSAFLDALPGCVARVREKFGAPV
ncbi:MAG: aminotransferase class V-fold PLP-dependent enzyme [Actinomycetales bacterium]|nr:aminotransferase class V-fold PLP-dependent enzyme [Actinomycetales bacterium]